MKKRNPKAAFGHRLASPWQRLVATTVETALLSMSSLKILLQEDIEFVDVANAETTLGWSDVPWFSILSALAIGAIGYPLWGGNLGHQIMGLKVISARTGKTIEKSSQGATREGLKILLMILGGAAMVLCVKEFNQIIIFFALFIESKMMVLLLTLLTLILLLAAFTLFSTCWLILDKRNQNLYDKLSKTLVVLDE